MEEPLSTSSTLSSSRVVREVKLCEKLRLSVLESEHDRTDFSSSQILNSMLSRSSILAMLKLSADMIDGCKGSSTSILLKRQ